MCYVLTNKQGNRVLCVFKSSLSHFFMDKSLKDQKCGTKNTATSSNLCMPFDKEEKSTQLNSWPL